VTSDGLEHFVAQQRNTLGLPNAGPKVGPVVINEIMFAPPPFGVDADTVDEYVELRNVSGQPAPLFDLLHSTNAWQLKGAVQFTFPPGATLPPWSFLLVVSFDPAQDTASLNWFRARYGLDTNAVILGPYKGHLANEGEQLALYQPGEPESASSPTPGFVPDVLVEEVHYSHLPPWPAATDGTGDSLQRLASISFADDPANWQAGSPTPGIVNVGAFKVDTDGDGMPDEAEFVAGTDPRNSLDFLHFDRVSSDGANCVLEFTGRSGHTYAVETLDHFEPPNTWTLLRDNLPGKDASIIISDPLTSEPRFYRLKVIRK
jgi:Bacterial TSP3 repeat